LVIGSVGNYLREKVLNMIKDIFNNNVKYKNNKTNYINKIILVPCSSGFKHSI